MNVESLLANQTAVKLIPQDAGAHNNLALAFKELGKFQDAYALTHLREHCHNIYLLSYNILKNILCLKEF